ncbi:class I SAM-dependent methyltransferase [Novosphingobium aquimarinum]|uniref:class I SAM-dependent methyltransferase n=1 Tax=Novosphingobium aquimarinum TaxID=2682494 RepID=UPI0018DD10DA|nr:class I SAM-dependent methyltransferase [Novosphingobium aquimarinum]
MFVARHTCPVCGAADCEQIYRCSYQDDPVKSLVSSNYAEQGVVDWSLLADAEFEVHHCPRCDLIYQSNVPGDALLEEIYTRMISSEALEQYERSLLTLDNFQRISGEFATIFHHMNKPIHAIRVLDYGMGMGRWARVARGMGAEVYATEIGDDKYTLGRALGIKMLEDEEVDGNTFDLVHTEQVCEHLVHPGRDFARLAKTLAPGGLFKVAVPYRGNLESILRAGKLSDRALFATAGARDIPGDAEASGAIQPLEHLNAYSAKTIDWLARDNGLEIVAQVRRRSVAIDTDSIKGMASGVKRLGVELTKAAIRLRIGYYLLRKPR